MKNESDEIEKEYFVDEDDFIGLTGTAERISSAVQFLITVLRDETETTQSLRTKIAEYLSQEASCMEDLLEAIAKEGKEVVAKA